MIFPIACAGTLKDYWWNFEGLLEIYSWGLFKTDKFYITYEHDTNLTRFFKLSIIVFGSYSC